MLARHFWQALGGDSTGPSPELLARWEDFEWPGNVRELRNAVARQLALGELAGTDPNGVPTSVGSASQRPPSDAGGDVIQQELAAGARFPQARDRVLAEFERR